MEESSWEVLRVELLVNDQVDSIIVYLYTWDIEQKLLSIGL